MAGGHLLNGERPTFGKKAAFECALFCYETHKESNFAIS